MSTTQLPSTTEVYKPTEHDGKKEDGGDDQRVSSEHGFGGDKELASEAGTKGGKFGGDAYKAENAGDFTGTDTKLE